MDERIASLLLDRAKRENPIAVTHQEIADELGSSREVISRVLDDLAGRGLLLTKRGSIEVTDVEGLGSLAGL